MLEALLSFHPEKMLGGNADMVVFPSNRALTERCLPTCAGGHRLDGPKANHPLTFNLDHSGGAAQQCRGRSKLRCFHAIPRLYQPRKLSRKLRVQTIQFSAVSARARVCGKWFLVRTFWLCPRSILLGTDFKFLVSFVRSNRGRTQNLVFLIGANQPTSDRSLLKVVQN
ncbi:helix-turn-helix domain-containing protein [Tateyamaria sp. Alg231-49]|uniref:helix-turn-helix domain-containing protein n=1 Tax=Tateyamaria sp. Alg231-49 TaxID=1922219 RepID=UPI000D5517C8|nr:helix-turn-helix domain-containing protein [Tateyamaria sp. Alg231-49]